MQQGSGVVGLKTWRGGGEKVVRVTNFYIMITMFCFLQYAYGITQCYLPPDGYYYYPTAKFVLKSIKDLHFEVLHV